MARSRRFTCARKRSKVCTSWAAPLVGLLSTAFLAVFLLYPEARPSSLNWLVPEGSRRLQRYTDAASQATATATSGCVTVDLSSTSVSIDMSTKACNGHQCPPCFVIMAANNDENTLTLQRCSTMYMGSEVKMGDVGTMFETSMQVMTFVNVDPSKQAVVVDGAGLRTRLRKGSSAMASCVTNGGDKLLWVSSDASSLMTYIVSPGSQTPTCPTGTTAVSDAAGCEKAADVMGYKYKGTETVTTHPVGCRGESATGEIRFNSGTGGTSGCAAHPHCVVACTIDAASYVAAGGTP